MNSQTQQQGVTLIELLVVMAILTMILGGIYGLFDSANRSYMNTRALVESQQTARTVLNYLLFRLREIDGSGLVKDPRYCTQCHQEQIDGKDDDNPAIPCPRDVRIPRRSLYIDSLETVSLPTLDVDSAYQNLSGHNSITFWADLLPAVGIADEFTDSPRVGPYSAYRNGKWDLTYDEDGEGYDPGEDYEVLYFDHNDNGEFDYYGEKWSFRLKTSVGQEYFQLVESLSFTDGVNDYSGNNKSTYKEYTDQPVAYGLTGLGIKKIPKFYDSDYSKMGEAKLKDTGCGGGAANRDTCHGEKVPSSEEWRNVYVNETAFNYEQFVKTHPWWNIKALSIEVATVDPQGKKFMKMKQVLIPRNFEVNQEYYRGK